MSRTSSVASSGSPVSLAQALPSTARPDVDRTDAQSTPSSPSSPRAQALLNTTRNRRRHSAGTASQLVKFAEVPRWISKANFKKVPLQGRKVLAAFNAVDTMYSHAQEKFGSLWQWTKAEAPGRARMQRGTLKDPNMRRDSDYPGSFQEFEQAFERGTMKEYLLQHLAVAPVDARSVRLFAQQLDNVFAKSCDELRELLKRHDVRPPDLARVLANLCKPTSESWSRDLLKAYYSDGKRLLVRAFAMALSDMLDKVLAGFPPAEAPSKEALLNNFYFLAAILLGYLATELQDELLRLEDRQKIEQRVDADLQKWKADNESEWKTRKPEQQAFEEAKLRDHFREIIISSIRSRLAAQIATNSGELIKRLFQGDPRLDPDQD